MTDQELKELVASFAFDSKEITAMQNETKRILQENAAIQKETSMQMQETDQQMKKLDRKLKELEEDLYEFGIHIGGISNNQGHHAEQFFQSVFEKKLEFGRIKYDEMIPNLTYKGKKYKIEFDIALVNGNSVALIEVKNRIHPDFVKKLAEERVEKFREYFREFENYDVYLGIAGFSFCDEVLEQASRYGIGIVRQVGEGVEVQANNLKVY